MTNYINKAMYEGDGLLEPVRFTGWAELKESFLSDNIQASVPSTATRLKFMSRPLSKWSQRSRTAKRIATKYATDEYSDRNSKITQRSRERTARACVS